MKKKSFLGIALALVFVLLGLTGCIQSEAFSETTAPHAKETTVYMGQEESTTGGMPQPVPTTFPKVQFMYLDSTQNCAVTTDNVQDFEANVKRDEPISVVFQLIYEPVDDDWRKALTADMTNEEIQAALQAHREQVKEANVAANHRFLEEHHFSLTSEDYRVTAGEYSPYLVLSFENYSKYETYFDQIVASTADDALLRIQIEPVWNNGTVSDD